MQSLTRSHRQALRIAQVIALVQFINALEYMAITPMFIYMAHDFTAPVSAAGLVAGVYVTASVVSGMLGFLFIDRANKKRLLLINTLCLGLITLLTLFATQMPQLLALRLLAGLFGGITSGVGLGIAINAAPDGERGKMLAIVFAAFPAVSIIGTPLSLYLAVTFHWKLAFILIAVLCAVSLPLIISVIPDTPPIQKRSASGAPPFRLIRAAGASAVCNFSPFLLIPILTPLLTNVFRVDDGNVPIIFLLGGLAAYIATRLTGKLCDRYRPDKLALMASLLFAANILLAAAGKMNGYLFFILFMFATYGRIAASGVLSSYASTPENRAGFGALQTALSHLGAAAAFFCSSAYFDGGAIELETVQTPFLLAALSALLLPFYLRKLNIRPANG